ncbi:MAG TPA: hypothetical protein VJK07_03490 [Candidatus Nanoarchaeia archaeon]|nr:hypothetical protein [Candidatus Nanoarchaeia archaeon]
MVWQDIVIALANVVFIFALSQQVYHGFKLKKTTITPYNSFPTFIGLYVMSLSFFTLGLYYSSLTAFLAGTLWLILYIQHFLYRN